MMETKLISIAKRAKQYPKEPFTALYHHINEELLRECHQELPANKATGIDGVTKKAYEENLTENLSSLVKRLKNHQYKPQPVRRVNIPKADGKSRPLGILIYEDKLVQLALNKIIEPIFEERFLDCSHGFRPGRNCHDALKQLHQIIQRGKTNYIVDVDIKGFFDNVDHQWLMRCLEQRIKDPNIKRLIVRMLKSGIIENNHWEPSTRGTIQGGNISPLFGNIYLHYVLDLWFELVVRKNCRGEAKMVRYCDDFICCFQYKEEAIQFYQELKQRLAKFGLEISTEKSKVLAFGRFAAQKCYREGKKKPDTFDFLGFTHYCSQGRNGNYRVKRKTSRKKFNAKVKAFKEWIKEFRALDQELVHKTTQKKLIGHYRYYGITDNIKMLQSYKYAITKLLFKWLNRRSQRRSYTYEKFNQYLKWNPLPEPKIYVNIYG
ncbi:group II intron reverse transcriptase/maturase [Desulfitispora alkaliphila]|uniref:group II intron reverse transcriptase/maturase n=1 Tax=Desulfitispora alkaliphila TaxID=622674 RepID=UPI003D1C3AA2